MNNLLNVESWRESSMSRERFPDDINLYDLQNQCDLEFLVRQARTISMPIILSDKGNYNSWQDQALYKAYSSRVHVEYYNKKYMPELLNTNSDIVKEKYLYVLDVLSKANHFTNKTGETRVCLSGFISDVLGLALESYIWSLNDADLFLNIIAQKILSDPQSGILKNEKLFYEFMKRLDHAKKIHKDKKLPLARVSTYGDSWIKVIEEVFFKTFNYPVVLKNKLYPSRQPSKKNKLNHYLQSHLDLINYRTKEENEFLYTACLKIGCDKGALDHFFTTKPYGVEQFSILEATKLLAKHTSRKDLLNLDFKVNLKYLSNKYAYEVLLKLLKETITISIQEKDKNLNLAILMMLFPLAPYNRYGYFFKRQLYKKATTNRYICDGFNSISILLTNKPESLAAYKFIRDLSGRWGK